MSRGSHICWCWCRWFLPASLVLSLLCLRSIFTVSQSVQVLQSVDSVKLSSTQIDSDSVRLTDRSHWKHWRAKSEFDQLAPFRQFLHSFLGKKNLPMRGLRTISHGSSCFFWLGTLKLTLIAPVEKKNLNQSLTLLLQVGRMDACEKIFDGNKTTFAGGKTRTIMTLLQQCSKSR